MTLFNFFDSPVKPAKSCDADSLEPGAKGGEPVRVATRKMVVLKLRRQYR
jgi:hypothetical protein